jgi:hypothetical protein
MPRQNIFPFGPYQTPLETVRAGRRGRTVYFDLPSFADIEIPQTGIIFRKSATLAAALNSTAQISLTGGRQFYLESATANPAFSYKAQLGNVDVTDWILCVGGAQTPSVINRQIFQVHFDTILLVNTNSALLTTVTFMIATGDAQLIQSVNT